MKRAALNGLPDATLTDCVFLTGKRGSGKSFLQRLGMERALSIGLRCGWVDAMGIGWGITVAADGRAPGFSVVVFGGEHGHIPITEHAGKALGTTLARAAFSWVVDLSKLPSKAARIRFMRDFGEALYENCESQLLLFFDEIDIYAPQNILDKQGPAAEMLGVMHELVRRGRIKGISVWMATQRPAEVSKGVISQADAMVTFKLMAPQDLEAAASWMKAHVGHDGKSYFEQLPALKVGQAIVYLTEPKIAIDIVQFPMIMTLDTFKPPKKGARQHSDKRMAAVDLSAIRTQLGEIEVELKANDPVALKARVAELERNLKAAEKAKPSPVPTASKRDVALVKKAHSAIADAKKKALTYSALVKMAQKQLGKLPAIPVGSLNAYIEDAIKRIEEGLKKGELYVLPQFIGPMEIVRVPVESETRPLRKPMVETREIRAVNGEAVKLGGPEKSVLRALGEWNQLGFQEPTRAQVAIFAGYHERTPSFRKALSNLSVGGMIAYRGSEGVRLTEAAEGSVNVDPVDAAGILARIRQNLDGPQMKVFDTLLEFPMNTAIERDEIALKAEYHDRTPSFRKALSKLSTMGVIEYQKTRVQLQPWVWGER